jgi:hypothetical protein
MNLSACIDPAFLLIGHNNSTAKTSLKRSLRPILLAWWFKQDISKLYLPTYNRANRRYISLSTQKSCSTTEWEWDKKDDWFSEDSQLGRCPHLYCEKKKGVFIVQTDIAELPKFSIKKSLKPPPEWTTARPIFLFFGGSFMTIQHIGKIFWS